MTRDSIVPVDVDLEDAEHTSITITKVDDAFVWWMELGEGFQESDLFEFIGELEQIQNHLSDLIDIENQNR